MTEPRLFANGELLDEGASIQPAQGSGLGKAGRENQVRRSALWAAYGDALGWISELVDEKGLSRRTLGKPLRHPIGWKRRIGGRAGITVDLPVGCYSDDTQLRLATARSIRPDGFDVEAFSKVELPVWPSYALGGGRSTSAAAANLAKPRVQWFANTFKGWTNSGGNGAAMRIQPHVWAASTPGDPKSFLSDVVKNAICTHSHPSGLMGAVLHSLTLASAMRDGHNPSPDDLIAATKFASNIPELIDGDIEVNQYWRPLFERDSGKFAEAWEKMVDECRAAVFAIAETPKLEAGKGYEAIINRLMLRDPARRGSGMLTALAAVGLIWCEPRPEEALNIAANMIGTDTDTIATMAGAILGVNAESDPPVEVLDTELFISESNRLSAIGDGQKPPSHQYPDLLRWSAPKTQADALFGVEDGEYWVDGLGKGEPKSQPIVSPDPGFMWQWFKLEFGQTLLIKRRKVLATKISPTQGGPSTRPTNQLQTPGSGPNRGGSNQTKADARSWSGSGPARAPFGNNSTRIVSPSELEAMIAHLRLHRNDDKTVGQVIRRVVNRCSPGQIGAFLAEAIECLREPSTPPGIRGE